MIDTNAFSITNRMLVEAAKNRGWGVEPLSQNGLLRLTTPANIPILVSYTNSEFVSSIGRVIAQKKHWTYSLCSDAGVPVPQTLDFQEYDESIEDFLSQHVRIVIKPADAAHGDGVTTDITDVETAKRAFVYAQEQVSSDTTIIVQQQVTGVDVRLLFIDETFVGAIRRHPAAVVGDGVRTVLQLIEAENGRPERGINYATDLNQINIDVARAFLGESIHSSPEKGTVIQVVGSVNIGQGGTSQAVCEDVHESYIELARKAKNACALTIAGVDLMVDDLTQPPSDTNSVHVIELNGGPMLAFHERPNYGIPKPVYDIYLDWLEQKATEKAQKVSD